MDPTPGLQAEIALLERRSLDKVRPGRLALVDRLNQHQFVRVTAGSNFWEGRSGAGAVDFIGYITDMVTAAHGSGNYLTFVLAGRDKTVELYYSLDNWELAQTLLTSAYPGITLEPKGVSDLGNRLKACCRQPGMMSGIPSRPAATKEREKGVDGEPLRLERVVRGMRGSQWLYMVEAYPRPATMLLDDRQELLDRMGQTASWLRRQIQQSTQTGRSPANRLTETVSQTMGGEIVNRQAEYAMGLMERELERLNEGLAVGRWQVAVYFAAAEEEALHRLAALLTGVLAGPASLPVPIRTHLCLPAGGAEATDFHTYLTSAEVAVLTPLLREESPGYGLTDLARFDVDFRPPAGPSVSVGEIQWDGQSTGQEYRLERDDLARHGVVFGVTGSGKTTTLLHLLDQLWQPGDQLPFLVIEPAKTEYRSLLGRLVAGTGRGPIPQLRLYTLGNDSVAPFRLNPFEFDVADKAGATQVLSHIDFLKAVFNAAFILYAPMPYVLEMALHEIYEDKGWNLATGTNMRLAEEEWSQRQLYPIFPTLTDLYHKVEAVTRRLGYEARIEQDVIAGLKARLGALRLGAKGLMLDTARGLSMAELLAQPTVLEMEAIGNDDEKTFLIGLLLARLYGFRRLRAMEGKVAPVAPGLRHVLVIEEAHRLLKHVSTAVETDSANLRAQAIETFVNMLSEVRHYGQGVLVAEQIPSKLTPDVIKNTNLKVVQRMVARDDRELLGTTMNMNEAQMARLATLARGQAVVFAEGDDHPYLVQVREFKKLRRLETPTDSDVAVAAAGYVEVGQYLAVPDLAAYGLRPAHFGGPEPGVYQAVLRYLAQPESQTLWARLLARTIFARDRLPAVIDELRRQVGLAASNLATGLQTEMLVMTLVLGAAQALQERGAEKGWPYAMVDGLRTALTAGLVKLVRSSDLKTAASDLDRFVRTYEKQSHRSWGPYPGCVHCRAVCFYRAETSRLLSPIDSNRIRATLTSSVFVSEEDRMAALSRLLHGTLQQWLGGAVADVDDMAYCTALVATGRLGLDEYEQEEFGRELAEELLG